MTNRALQVFKIRQLIIFIVRSLYYSQKDRWALLVWSISSSRTYPGERIKSLVNRKWFVNINPIRIMELDYRDHKFMIVSSLIGREEEMKRTMTWWGQVVDDIRYVDTGRRRDEYQKSEKKEDDRVTIIWLRMRKTRITVDRFFESWDTTSSYRMIFL